MKTIKQLCTAKKHLDAINFIDGLCDEKSNLIFGFILEKDSCDEKANEKITIGAQYWRWSEAVAELREYVENNSFKATKKALEYLEGLECEELHELHELAHKFNFLD